MLNFLILLAILALLMFGPRRGGKMPSPAAIAFGLFIILYMTMAFGCGALWNAVMQQGRR